MLAKSIGELRKIRPHAVEFFTSSGVFSDIRRSRKFDEAWLITDFAENELKLSHPSTGYFFSLPTDHIREYRSNPSGPGFLILKSQVIIDGRNISLEPLPTQNAFAP